MEEALRLTFENRGGEIIGLTASRVRMVIPKLPGNADLGSIGRFVELRSAEGETLQLTRVSGEGSRSIEFPTGNHNREFGRTEPPPGATFSVLVPYDDRATHAALVELASEGDPGLLRTTSRELAVLPLTDVRRYE